VTSGVDVVFEINGVRDKVISFNEDKATVSFQFNTVLFEIQYV